MHIEVRKGIHGLHQAGIIAHELLSKQLMQHGSYQSQLVHRLWNHE